MSRLARVLCLTAVLALSGAGSALADGPVGADPGSNFPVPELPASCGAPTSAACVNASISDLNQARANLGIGPYALPSNFDSLTPAQQGFVLANLDRIQYGLAPITGMTDALGQDAEAAIQKDTDPQPTDSDFNYWTSNWAGGFQNVELGYDAWMYDDGPGSGNLDCTASDPSGCWGHRHDILWQFGGSGALAMGVAAGNDSSGSPGFAMLLGMGDGNYQPSYNYTWAQAVANGANSGNSGVTATPPSTAVTPAPTPAPTPKAATHKKHPKASAPAGVAAGAAGVHVSVRGRRVTVRVTAPAGTALSCSLSRHTADGWVAGHFRHCSTQVVFSQLRTGRYRLQVRAGHRTVTHLLSVG